MPIDAAELMKKVRGIRILTGRLVDERLAGDYHSAFKGQGLEFDEIRAYVPGDDVRSIDWNVTARTGFPQVKRFAEERQLTVIFAVDVSGSQSFGSGGRRTKAELSAEIACLLALTSIRNQDNVGLLLFSDRVLKWLPPRRGRTAVLRIVREVLAAGDDARGGTDLAAALERLEGSLHRKAVVFLVSDFQAEGWEKRLAALARRHDLVCCPVRDPAEADLPAAGLVELEDPETGESVWADLSSPALRAAFGERAAKTRAGLRALFRRHGIDEMEFSTDSDPIGPIRAFFRKRAARRRRSGQAMVEFVVGLVALLAVAVGILSVAALVRADTESFEAAQEEAVRRGMGNGTPQSFSPVADVAPGPDGLPLTKDDAPVAGSLGSARRIAARAESAGGPARRPDGGPLRHDAVAGFGAGASGDALFSMRRGRGEATAELPPAAKPLFGLEPVATLRNEVWLPQTGGVP